MQESKAKY